ncbi:MAG: hypothetical protein ACFFAU_09110 [Candidatus Hodarchaeota archaeon]
MNEKNDITYSRLEDFKSEWRKKSFIAYIFWVLLAICLTIVIYVNFQIHDSPVRNLIYSFLFATVIIAYFTSIPFLSTLIIIVFRTRSKNFFYQLFTNLGLLILVTLASMTSFVKLEENFFTIIYIGFLLLLAFLEAIFLHLVVQGARNNKKPIFLWTFYQDTFEAYSSSFLSQQALLIDEQKNGYSQRPFFLNFIEISQYCRSSEEFKSKMKNYAKFLAEKSELIGFDIFETTIKLYPRVLMGYRSYGFGIRYTWDIFLKVIKKKGLTSIAVNFTEQEISLRIAKEDYDLLNDVTYHLLGQLVLKRFKESIVAFLEENQEKSYSTLFPLEK